MKLGAQYHKQVIKNSKVYATRWKKKQKTNISLEHKQDISSTVILRYV